MKRAILSFLTCLLLFVHLGAYPDRSLPEAEPFPLERLEELLRALDAARGDAAAVEVWLREGRAPDGAGELDLVHSASTKPTFCSSGRR